MVAKRTALVRAEARAKAIADTRRQVLAELAQMQQRAGAVKGEVADIQRRIEEAQRRESGAQPQVSPEEEQLIRTAVQQEWAACVGTQLDELRTQVEAARRQMQSRYEKLAAEAGSSMEAKYTKLLMKCEALRLTSQKAAAAAGRRLDELEPRVAGYAATRKAQAREDEKRALLRELRRRARTRWRSRGLSGCHAAVGFLQRVANQAAPCDAVLQKCRCEAERLQAQRAVKQYLRAASSGSSYSAASPRSPPTPRAGGGQRRRGRGLAGQLQAADPAARGRERQRWSSDLKGSDSQRLAFENRERLGDPPLPSQQYGV